MYKTTVACLNAMMITQCGYLRSTFARNSLHRLRGERSRRRRLEHLQNARADDDEDEESQHHRTDAEILLLRAAGIH